MGPSEILEGVTLGRGWTVKRKVVRKPTATGGCFSTGYVVVNDDGRQGYLKAMDYLQALRSPNSAEMLKYMTDAYTFEKRICEKCRDHRLSRIVHAMDSGSIMLDPENPATKVEYLIFELADGDVRAHLDAQDRFDCAFALRTLHNVAVGLEQLHKVRIAHQDLKPSNILVFADDGGSKLTDLGRAWSSSVQSPYDAFAIAGDQGYAPPELLYHHVPVADDARRFGCDTYHLGSLVAFLFIRAHMNALLIKHLAPEHRPHFFREPYENILPYLKAAFAQALEELAAQVRTSIRSDIVEVVSQLCDPAPTKRGHPSNRRGTPNQYSLERYVSRFNLLATRAEYGLLGL